MREVTTERWVDIPEPVRDVHRQCRPSPPFRARALERALDLPTRIDYKYEGVSPAGNHQPNTAVPQAFFDTEAGIKRISTENGAGRWGPRSRTAGALFGIDMKVFMDRVSFEQKPYREALMNSWSKTALPARSKKHTWGARF